MFVSKYYAAIEASQRKDPPDDALPPFNLDELGADSWRQRFKTWLIGAGFPPLLFLLREFLPVATIGSFVVVTRDADVRDVLARPQEFEVPFGREADGTMLSDHMGYEAHYRIGADRTQGPYLAGGV